ncbi:MAG: helix-turn-helix domain-containing protein [Bacteroidales bacterium]|nr:helix-turn-helix domain-containing protein [Bacteroidales bacterium]
MNLIELAKTCPDVFVSVRLGDLLDANEKLARKVRAEVEAEQQRRREEYGDYLIPKEEARRMLGKPDPSTMWRWEKKGYLSPVKIGDRVYYRESAVDAIIEKNTVRN